jgi:hypothetical protein
MNVIGNEFISFVDIQNKIGKVSFLCNPLNCLHFRENLFNGESFAFVNIASI